MAYQPLSVLDSLLSPCSLCTLPESLLLQKKVKRLKRLLMFTIETKINFQRNISPSLCLQTWKASSVANRVLGWRIKIFVLAMKANREISKNVFFQVSQQYPSEIWYSSVLPTFPSCTHQIYSPGVWSDTSHLLLQFLSSWAKCQDTEVYTWAQKVSKRQKNPDFCFCFSFCMKNINVTSWRLEECQRATSGERFHICDDKQNQHAWLSGVPSVPGISPDALPTRHQSVLQETPQH